MKAAFIRCAAAVTILIPTIIIAVTHTFGTHRAANATWQQPGAVLNVMFDPSILDPNTQQLYQTMQNHINGYAITPAARTNYYSAVNNANGWVISNWQGIITAVEQNCNGYLVTIAIVPAMSQSNGPACPIISSDYTEQYQVFPDNTFQYLNSFDPQGLAGQMPEIIMSF